MSKTAGLVRVAGMAACGSLVLALAGCGDRSEASQATRDASLEIDKIAGGGGGGMVSDYTVAQFEAASKPLNRTGLDGTDSEKAAAVILASWAEVGLASGDALTISELERGAVEKMAEIRSELRAWEQLRARAAADEAIDPSDEIASLDSERSEIEASIEAATQTKASVDREIAALESQIEALGEEARAERAEAAKLELRAAQMSAVEAAELAPQIQEHALGAEKKLLDIARLQAKADQLGTAATEATLNLEMFNEQKALNEQARADILADRDAALANAARLKAEAGEAASRISTLVNALQAYRGGDGADGSLNRLYETQVERLRSAVSEARQGSTAMRSEARIAMGAANAALGEALSQQAYSYGDLAGLLNRLAEASPALPERAAYAEAAASAAATAERASEEARAAFEAASNDYSGTGVRGEASELLNTLVERLRARGGAASDAGGSDAGESDPDAGGSDAGEDIGGDELIED